MKTVAGIALFFLFFGSLLAPISAWAEGEPPPPDPVGTVDQAILFPDNLPLLVNEDGYIRFSAKNTKGFPLKTFEALFSYGSGLQVSLQETTPYATISEDPAKRTFKFVWNTIDVETELKATIRVSSTTVGTYSILPTSIKYTDTARNRYTGACSSATVTVTTTPPPPPDTIAPAAPQIWSLPGNGMVELKSLASVDTDVAGYKLFRRVPGGTYVQIASPTGTPLKHWDTTVQAGQTYIYRAQAVDNSGNESGFSRETMVTYLPPALVQTLSVSNVSSAAVGDLNGDGLRDVVLGNANNASKNKGGQVSIFWGLAGGGLNGSPLTITSTENGDEFGRAVAVVDLNNDGAGDLIVGAPGHDETVSGNVASEAGKIYIYAGKASFSTSPVQTLAGGPAYDCWGSGIYIISERWAEVIAPAGDVNHDGFPDAVLGIPQGGRNRSGKVILLYGSNPIGTGGSVWQSPNCQENFGRYAASAGDVDHDGYDDFLVDSLGKGTYLVRGGLDPQPAPFSSSGLNGAGLDFNADGFSDLILGGNVYHGGAAMDQTPDQAFNLVDQTSVGYDRTFNLGDLNQDGYQDVLWSLGTTVKGCAVAYGGPTSDNLLDVAMVGSPSNILAVGDLGNDGRMELVAGNSIYSLANQTAVPEINLTTPAYGSATASSSIQVQGSVRGTVARLWVAGQETPVNNGAFSAQVPLTLGLNLIEMAAEAADGKVSRRFLRLTYNQPDPLAITVNSPADGATVNASPVTVSGYLNQVPTLVAVNGQAATLSGSSFQASVSLAEGPNTLTIQATDVYDQTATKTLTVTLVTTGVIQGVVTDAGTGSVMPGAGVNLVDAGQHIHSTLTDANGAYQLAGVTQGDWSATFNRSGYITATATGSLTAGQTLIQNMALMPIPPLTVTLAAPADGSTVHQTPVSVSGSVSHEATVTVNGQPVALSGLGFSTSAALTEGSNPITVQASDTYGQTASAGATVTLVYLAPTASLTASTTGIIEGQSTTLFWNTTDADSVTIAPDVGTVGASGSTTVSPTTTTTYTLTATGPGGTASAQTIITVTPPAPSITFSASPDAIQTGQSTTLTWTTAHADTVSITPDLGDVATSGSQAVTPAATTTYTLTATGPGGTATADATVAVTFPPPTIDFSVSPATIRVGQSATLAWITDQADSVTIEPGLGAMPVNGSVDVSPETSATYTLTATGPGGTRTASANLSVDNPFTLDITSPLEGASIDRPNVLVEGTFINGYGHETGVVVNGLAAMIDQGRFVANHVPLQDGENTITVTLTDSAGYRLSRSVHVTADTSGPSITVQAEPEAGVAPLKTRLNVTGTVAITSATLSCDCPAEIQILEQTVNSFLIEMATPGQYRYTVEVPNPGGGTLSDTVVITVMDPTEMDAFLQSKWAALKQALIAGNVDTAVSCHHEATQAGYREIYTALGAQLPTIASQMGPISPVYFEPDRAQYRIHRDRVINGQTYSITYYIIFRLNPNGLWAIERY